MSSDDRTGRADGQQGTGGIDHGRASSAPNPQGSQPHLGGAAGGSGETEGAGGRRITAPDDHEELDALDQERTASRHTSRLDIIAAADNRTEALNPHRGARANDASGGLRELLSGPTSNEGYLRGAQHETPVLGATDDDADNM